MADQARVASIEALEDFRTALVRYQGRAKQALEDVGGEVKRLREWLAFDRRMHWEGEVRRCTRRLEQAEAELTTARFSALQDDHSAQQMAVKKARRMLEAAEEKLRVTRKWIRDFDSIVEPEGRQLDGLRERLAQDFPKAISAMGETIGVLKEYAEVRSVGSKPPMAADVREGPAPEGGGG